MKHNFQLVFIRLRAILLKYSTRLTVSADTPTRYCLTGGQHPAIKKPMPVAWVQIDKAYVSFHHMGVYAFPGIRDGMTKELRARMQGKSCFNFTRIDDALFAELETIVEAGFAAFKGAGYLGHSDPGTIKSPKPR